MYGFSKWARFVALAALLGACRPALPPNAQTGTATLLAARGTGTRINGQPEMALDLEVTSERGERWRLTIEEVLAFEELYLLRPGTELPVRFDPADRSHVELDRAGAAAVLAARRQELATLQVKVKRQQELLVELQDGELAEAEVVEAQVAGVLPGGKAQYVEFVLQVRPAGGAPFAGRAGGVVLKASMPKYEAGRRVMVRFDAQRRVAVVGTPSEATSTPRPGGR
jgi:hypothetical protein